MKRLVNDITWKRLGGGVVSERTWCTLKTTNWWISLFNIHDHDTISNCLSVELEGTAQYRAKAGKLYIRYSNAKRNKQPFWPCWIPMSCDGFWRQYWEKDFLNYRMIATKTTPCSTWTFMVTLSKNNEEPYCSLHVLWSAFSLITTLQLGLVWTHQTSN